MKLSSKIKLIVKSLYWLVCSFYLNFKIIIKRSGLIAHSLSIVVEIVATRWLQHLKSHLLGVKKLKYPNIHFTVLSPCFLLSFDLSLSCKLQLIDLITVFATFLVGRQTILVSFFSENAGTEKRQIYGKIKEQVDATDTPLTFCP